MAKPASIQRLEAAYGLTLTDIYEIPAQKKIIDWQAYLAAFEAGRDTDAAAIRTAALGRMKMSVCANTYLLDEQDRVIALNLYGNVLPEFSFADWETLQVLVLSGNALTEIRLPGSMIALQFLDLGDNPELRRLHFEGALPALDTLDASDSGLEALDVPAGFTGLKTLDVSRNRLASAVFQGDCPALEWLDLSGNALVEFELGEGFPLLAYLYLSKNQIAVLDFARPLRNLRTLHLSDNELSTLPRNFLSFTNLDSLYLQNNKLTGNLASVIPRSESANAFVAVRDYVREFSKGTIQNDRVKIIIVGNGRTGKTSMFRRLKGLPFRIDEQITHGVSLGELEKQHLPDVKTEKLKAIVWDFGGQHIFYATHQFFLTDNALYILTWTAEENVAMHRERDKGKLPFEEKWLSREYWLDNIRLHAPGSPILMVQTHHDGVHEPYNQTAYSTAPFSANCLEFAAITDHGLSDLIKNITQALNESIPTFGEEFPETYDRVIGEVECIKTQNKISRTTFDAICQSAGITDGGETSVLEFLRTVGVVVWFDRVDALRDTIFVNPDWLTKQVYRLINNELVASNGRFDLNYLASTFPEFLPNERQQLVALLQNFELIFEAYREGVGVYISPMYLPESLSEEAKIQLEKTKRRLTRAFVFRFPRFVPENVMVNLLSRYGPFSDQIYWKNGVAFTSVDDLDCIVEYNKRERALSVFAPSDEASYYFQADICRAFVELSRNANAEISLDGQQFVSWQGLARALELGNLRMDSSSGMPIELEDFKRFFIRESLNNREKTVKIKPVIFFSYAWRTDTLVKIGSRSWMNCMIALMKMAFTN